MVNKDNRSRRSVILNLKKNTTEQQDLEVDVETTVVNDEQWNCIVGILVESHVKHVKYIEYMTDAIKAGLRRAIQSVTYSDITKTVCSLRSDKPGNLAMEIQPLCPGHQKLCDDAYPYLGVVGNRIPTPLLARLIKYQILSIKAEYIKQREREITLAQEIQEESKLMWTSAASMKSADKSVKGSIKPNETKVSSKKEVNSKSQAADRTKVKDKKATKLRKRGEEWMDIEFIDDAPVEGPNLYILLSGFYDVSLAAELLRLGVPVCCMIKTQGEDKHDTNKGTSNIKFGSKPAFRTLYLRRYSSTSTIDNITIQSYEISVFWVELENILLEPSLIYLFRDVAFLTLQLPSSEVIESTNKANLEQLMYDNISYLLYDLQDTIRQHNHYLKNMKVLKLDGKHLFSIEDMTIYNALLDDVPAECRTIPLTLHCMLQQVDFTSKSNVSSRAEFIKSTKVGKEGEEPDVVKSSLAETFDKLNKKHGLADISRNVVDFKEPLIVIYGDRILKKTYHCFLPLFDAQQITCNMLRSIPPAMLWQWYRNRSIESKATFQSHIEKLLECVDESYLEIRTLHNRLHAVVFRKMKCSKFEGVRLHTGLASVDSSTKFHTTRKERSLSLGSLPSCSKKEGELCKRNFVTTSELKCTELTDLLLDHEHFVNPYPDGNTMNHKLLHPGHFDKFPHRFVEEKSANVLLQTLQEVFSYFACMDHSYFAPTDTLLLKFHNPIDDNGVFEELYECHVTTPVSLRDFVEYIVEEESEWLHAAEKTYHSSFVDKDPVIRTSFVGEHVVDGQKHIGDIPFFDMIFILKGSLKHEKLLKDMVELQTKSDVKITLSEASNNTQEKNSGLTRKSSKSVLKKGEQKKSEEKTRSGQKGKKNKPNEDSKVPSVTPEPSIPPESHAFVGVNLGPMRFQINGNTSYFCSLDGSRVKVHLANWLYKWKMLSLEFFKGGHTFMVHHCIGKVTTLSKPVAFHAVLDCGIVLAFERPKKKLFSNSTASNMSSTVGTHSSFANRKIRKMYTKSKHGRNKRKTLTSPSAASLHITSEVPDIQLEFVLNLSWPSGLFLETIKEPFVPFYVKQRYLTNGPLCTRIKEEKFRCYLQNGNILKFMINGSVEILYPDSTIIVCSNLNLIDEEVREKEPVEEQNVTPVKVKGSKIKGKVKKSESKGGNLEMKISSIQKTKEEAKELMFSISDEQVKEDNVKTPHTLLDVTEYFLVSPSGRQFLVKGGVKEELVPKCMIRTVSDIETEEIFTRRGDSTNTLLLPDGTSVVHFKDGSRITQSVVVDPNEIFCDWTGDEVAAFYSKKDLSNRHLIKKVHGSYYNHVNEGYVLLRVMYRLEHPNYATVIYHDGRLMCELVMPQDNAIVKMFTNGTYCITASNNVQLDVGSDTVRFDHLNPVTGVSMCSSIVNLSEISTEDDDDDDDDEPHMLSETTDVERKTTFQVGFDGETHVITGEKSEKMNVNSETRALMRYFSLNRDLTGQEFILENEVEAITECVSRNKYSSIVTDNFPDEPQLDFHIFMSSLDKNESESWLVEYKPQRITSEQQRIYKFDTRSTYGDPPSWFHPFPKRRHLQSTRASGKVSLDDSPGDEDIPDVLLVRMVKAMAPSSTHILRNTYKSIKKYRQLPTPRMGVHSRLPAVSISLIFKLHQSEQFQNKSRRRPEWQDKTSSAARELYLLGRMRKLKMNSSQRESFRMKAIEPLINKTLIKSWKNDREKLIIEYRNALRHRIVAPYFSSYAGDIFLIIQEAVDRAVDLVEERRQDMASELNSEEMSIEEEESTPTERTSNDQLNLSPNITPDGCKRTTGDRLPACKHKYRGNN